MKMLMSRWRVLALVWAAMTSAPLLAGAQDILILRPIDHSATEVTEDSIDLAVTISAFDPIQEVTINGAVQTITPGLEVRVQSKQALTPGSNTFEVTAKTATATASRTFYVYRVEQLTGPEEPREKKIPLDLVVAFGAQNNTNAYLASESEESGLKLFALAVPSYDIALADDDKARISGVLYREMYTDSALESAEVQFTRATGEWIRPLHEGWFSLGGGVAVVDTGFDNPVTGQDQSEQDIFAFARMRSTISETDHNTYEVELMRRDREDPADSDFSEDALLLTAHAALERQLSRYRSVFKGWATWDESEGKYSDKYIVRATADAKTPAQSLFNIPTGSRMNKLVLGAGAGLRLRKYAQSNPAAGKAEQDILLSVLANATYPFRRDWMVTGELARDQQTSNVSAAEYENYALTVTFIYIY